MLIIQIIQMIRLLKKKSLLDIALNAAKDENLDEVIEKDNHDGL